MAITVIAAGQRMPAWVDQGVAEYSKRLQREPGFSLIEVPLAKRAKSQSLDRSLQKEADAMLAKIPAGDYVVALEVGGRVLSTETLARRLQTLQEEAQNLSLLIGGPDGLAQSCRERAGEQWSLSALTLPHPLVRILIAEQIYRAYSLLRGHPYHRA